MLNLFEGKKSKSLSTNPANPNSSTRMSIDEFIKTHKTFIDTEIRKAYPPDLKITNKERKEWVYADEDIYKLARSLQVLV